MPFADLAHLEICFGGRPMRDGVGLQQALEAIPRSHVTTMDVTVRGRAFEAAAAVDAWTVAEHLPRLEAVSVILAGAPGPVDIAGVMALHEKCAARGITFAADFLLDADADVLDALGSRASANPVDSLTAVLQASRVLLAEGLRVRWIIPLLPALVYRLEALVSFAGDQGVEPLLAPIRYRFAVPDGEGPPDLGVDDRRFLADFVKYRLLDEERHLLTPDRVVSYRALEGGLTGGGFRLAETGPRVIRLDVADGEEGFRWSVTQQTWPSLLGVEGRRPRDMDNASYERGRRLIASAIGAAAVVLEGADALAHWVRARGVPARAAGNVDHGTRIGRVLLIGAYGGEHIGDAAILGGVLFRINRRYGTTRAILMSQRPEHTRHLVPMLATPCEIDVEAYERRKIRERLLEVDAVVFAGGPLIDLPRQLVKHLYTVSLARRAGKPFIMEGIGPGPFPRRPSEWTARCIVSMAQRVSVRTSTDARHPLMRGVNPEVGQDPAFDYLATRGSALTHQREDDRQWVDRLLKGTDGRALIGLNLRPIRHLFTVGAPALKRAEYTRLVERRFEEHLAEGLRRFQRASAVSPCFVFFPMNAIQFGMSDLRSAYRLKRLLRDDVDLRVWEADASLDGVVALLRRLDIVITMRFHATIFALAQQRRVIGIDYRVGKRDKVGALLSDFGQSENCCRIDELTADWLYQRLRALSTAATPQGGGPAVSSTAFERGSPV